MARRLKILPVTIAAALLLLTVKAGQIWQGADAFIGTSPAIAAEHVPTTGAGEATAGGTEDLGVGLGQIDLTRLTPAEMELLENLAERRVMIEARAREVEMREKLLIAAEQRAEAKIAELRKLQTTIEDLIKGFDESENAKIKSLVKIYETMKPKAAAAIFNELETGILLTVVGGMREAKVAAILAKMDSRRARALTTDLAQRRELPNVAGAAN